MRVARARAYVVVGVLAAVRGVSEAPRTKVHGAGGTLDAEASLKVGDDDTAARSRHVCTVAIWRAEGWSDLDVCVCV